MKIGYTLIIVSTVPLFSLIQYADALGIILIQMTFACFASIFMGPMNTYIVEMFRPEERYSCSAVSYGIGMGIFGGTAPLVASYLTTTTHSTLYLALYLSFGAFMGIVSLYLVSLEQKNSPLKKDETLKVAA